MASELDEIYAIETLLNKAAEPRDLVAAFGVFDIQVSLLNAPVAATLFRSAVAGDTSAAKMWLINRDPASWSTRSRAPQAPRKGPDGDEESRDSSPANPFERLRLVG